ncbi:MAG: hypothetical protein M0T84_14685 [Betaproteobacteria bacterium]|nr:hypothetical protein [Betaproteobacteria bacterium]
MLAVLVVLGGWATAHAKSPTLSCTVKPPRPVLGQAVTWEIAARDLPEMALLKSADFGSDWLLKDQTSDRSSMGPGTSAQTISVILYPLKSGAVVLPSVQAGTRRCAARRVVVADHAPGQPPQYVASRIEPARPVVGQAARVELDVGTGGAFDWHAVDAHASAGVMYPISTLSATTVGPDGAAIPVQRQTWSFTPLRPGDMSIDFGTLRATPFGQLVVYPVPALHLHVLALPAYWPVGAPVGRATLVEGPAPARLSIGGAGVLRATLSGVQVSRQGLIKMVQKIRAPDGITLYPPRVEREPVSAHQVTPTWTLELPFRVERAGVAAYPRLLVPYFDPPRGAPGLAVADWGRVHVDDPRPARVLKASGLAASLGLLLMLGRLAVRRIGERRCLARWRRIVRAADADALVRLWREAIARGDDQTMSLRVWVGAQRCGGEPLRVAGLEALLASCEHRRYARAPSSASDGDPA